MADIFDFSGTPASNTSINGTGCNTGMTPANVDNCIRELMAASRNTFGAIWQAILATTTLVDARTQLGAAGTVSPALTGTPTAPTAASGTNTTQISTTAFVQTAIAAGKPVVSTVSASFSAADADNNTHKVASGAAQTLTLGSITAGVAFTLRFTTAWSLSCAGGLSKNGASPTSVTSGSVAANSAITFVHEGAGVWLATGSGLT